jgi:hypothetical protein
MPIGHPAIHFVGAANSTGKKLLTLGIVAELLQLSGIDTQLAGVGSAARNANAGRPKSSTS